MYKRSLAISEKALGPDHPTVASSLENYAGLLERTKRQAEADKLKERAAKIRKGKSEP
ncbi:MAG: tetratricopeptide repeat protein [Planctomycetes bacterium]|nr:tetratricopeptide repeat protein [Planctomycetota bacterium]